MSKDIKNLDSLVNLYHRYLDEVKYSILLTDLDTQYDVGYQEGMEYVAEKLEDLLSDLDEMLKRADIIETQEKVIVVPHGQISMFGEEQ